MPSLPTFKKPPTIPLPFTSSCYISSLHLIRIRNYLIVYIFYTLRRKIFVCFLHYCISNTYNGSRHIVGLNDYLREGTQSKWLRDLECDYPGIWHLFPALGKNKNLTTFNPNIQIMLWALQTEAQVWVLALLPVSLGNLISEREFGATERTWSLESATYQLWDLEQSF